MQTTPVGLPACLASAWKDSRVPGPQEVSFPRRRVPVRPFGCTTLRDIGSLRRSHSPSPCSLLLDSRQYRHCTDFGPIEPSERRTDILWGLGSALGAETTGMASGIWRKLGLVGEEGPGELGLVYRLLSIFFRFLAVLFEIGTITFLGWAYDRWRLEPSVRVDLFFPCFFAVSARRHRRLFQAFSPLLD